MMSETELEWELQRIHCNQRERHKMSLGENPLLPSNPMKHKKHKKRADCQEGVRNT